MPNVGQETRSSPIVEARPAQGPEPKGRAAPGYRQHHLVERVQGLEAPECKRTQGLGKVGFRGSGLGRSVCGSGFVNVHFGMSPEGFGFALLSS